MTFDADQVRDFNTRLEDQLGDGSVTIRANPRNPSRLLEDAATIDPTPSNVLGAGEVVDSWRATFQVDADNEVIPGSDVLMEFSTDGGATWRDLYEESNLGEEGYGQYKVSLDGGTNADGPNAGDEWISVVSTSATDTDGTGFMMSDQPITTGQFFTTYDVANANSEFTVCFTTGMRIETENGQVAVEDLQIGDMVKTLDRGLQPVRFIYRRPVRAIGAMRPVVFEKGVLGDNERFVVSQKHRIHMSMLKNVRKSLGSYDALIEAIQLVNGSTIRVTDEFTTVEYFHIMFDNHELVWSEGVLSESWQPHRRNLRRDKALREELLAIFPEIATKGSGVNPAPARQTMEFRKPV